MTTALRQRLEKLSTEQRHQLASSLGLEAPKVSELVAFVTGRDALDEAALQQSLQQNLPRHMLPQRLVVLDKLPRTLTGKIDYTALKETTLSHDPTVSSELEDDIERRVSTIWADILDVSLPGREDDFFDLGGHSLLAMRLFSCIEQEFGKTLPLATIFTRPTIASLAELIRPQLNLDQQSSIVTLQAGSTLAPLFCMHCGAGNVFHYRKLGKLLGSDRPVLGLVPSGLDGQSSFHTTVEDMAASYAEQIQSVYPDGPYLLCGWSFGGTVAFEVARQLRAAGREVAYTGLFDAGVFGTLRLADNLQAHRQRFGELAVAQKLSYIAKSAAGNLRSFIRNGTRSLRRQGKLIPARIFVGLGRPLPVRLQAAYLGDIFGQAMLDYVPKPYDSELTIYRQDSGVWLFRNLPDMGWAKFTEEGKLTLIDLPGEHGDLFEAPLVESLASSLKPTLRGY